MCYIEGVLVAGWLFVASVLTVGPGREFSRLDAAVRAARAGDTIEVFPAPGGYRDVAIDIRVPDLTFEGEGTKPVKLDGRGFEYSGVGATPRAILQVDPGGRGATIRNFALTGAHNNSHNGAGIRVNGARAVTVTGCDISGNDMGIMSAASTGANADAADQLIQRCHIHGNGDAGDSGYNHNLYLGGMSVTLRHCEIDHSVTGHNLKSRAHFTMLEDCLIHDAANRELDFVEASETAAPNSNAILVNCVIAKSPTCTGNRGVIHFGRERGVRRGGLWIIHCTVLTPFSSAVVQLDGADVHAELDDNIVVNTEQAAPTLIAVGGGANPASVAGVSNWLSSGYRLTGTSIDPRSRLSGSSRADTLGIRPPSYRAKGLPPSPDPRPAYYRDGEGHEWEVAPSATLGARPTYRPGL